MKTLTLVTLTALVLAPFSQVGATGMHGKKKIQMLNDSAAALSSINPDLSGRLKSYADKEASETKESEMSETKATRAQDAQLLSESANALEASRPDLAKKLKKCAAKENKEMKRESAAHSQSAQ